MSQEDTPYDFIAFIDDDGTPRDAYVHVLEVREGFVTFQTKGNTITIPSHRLLKIKRRIDPTQTTPAQKEAGL